MDAGSSPWFHQAIQFSKNIVQARPSLELVSRDSSSQMDTTGLGSCQVLRFCWVLQAFPNFFDMRALTPLGYPLVAPCAYKYVSTPTPIQRTVVSQRVFRQSFANLLGPDLRFLSLSQGLPSTLRLDFLPLDVAFRNWHRSRGIHHNLLERCVNFFCIAFDIGHVPRESLRNHP